MQIEAHVRRELRLEIESSQFEYIGADRGKIDICETTVEECKCQEDERTFLSMYAKIFGLTNFSHGT